MDEEDKRISKRKLFAKIKSMKRIITVTYDTMDIDKTRRVLKELENTMNVIVEEKKNEGSTF